MAAASPLPFDAPATSREHRVLLYGVSWATYVSFRDAVDSPGIRMTYLEGTLEILRTSGEREVNKKMLSRLFELFCFERSIPLYAYGSMTIRKEEEGRGLEPDECYSREQRRDCSIPDIAFEVVVSPGSVDKLNVYAGLGIREVWLYEKGALRVLALHDSAYVVVPASRVFPEVALTQLARFVLEEDQHEALKAFRAELRAER